MEQYAKDINIYANLKDEEKKILFNSSNVTMFFNFTQENFDKIPKEMMKEVLKPALKYSSNLLALVQSEKELKKFVNLMSGVFEMIPMFMEDSREISSYYKKSQAFSLDQKTFKELQ